MTSSPVRPANSGGNAEQPAGAHAPGGIGSAWGCQVTPPSWLTSSAPARSLQSVVSQPWRGFANTMPVLSRVADLPLQRAQGLFRGLALGQLLVVVGAAGAVPVADLFDRGHVDGVVEPPVPAPAQPVDLARAGGHLDRRGAVVGGEVIPAAEAGHVADVADDGGGDDGADPEQPGQAGAGRPDSDGELLPGLAQLGVDAAQVLDKGRGQLAAGGRHRVCGPALKMPTIRALGMPMAGSRNAPPVGAAGRCD